jgi:hypothetical protein
MFIGNWLFDFTGNLLQVCRKVTQWIRRKLTLSYVAPLDYLVIPFSVAFILSFLKIIMELCHIHLCCNVFCLREMQAILNVKPQ